MDERGAGPHLDQDCLAVPALALYQGLEETAPLHLCIFSMLKKILSLLVTIVCLFS